MNKYDMSIMETENPDSQKRFLTMRKIIAIIIFILCFSQSYVFAENNINFAINGELMKSTVLLQSVKGYTIVPVSAFSESIVINADWNDETETVIIKSE